MSGHVRKNSDAIQTTDDFSVSFETINEKQPAEASSAGCAEIQQHDLHSRGMRLRPSHGFAGHFLQNAGNDVEPFHEVGFWNIQRRQQTNDGVVGRVDQDASFHAFGHSRS
jgi:hypothetical protein